MPRVAFEAHSVALSRAHSPGGRGHSDAAAKPSPFSEMLDSATPPADPAPGSRQARTERPERSDRADKSDKPQPAEPKSAESKSAKPKGADDRPAVARPAKDSADAQDSKTADSTAAGSTDDIKNAEDGKAADGSKDIKGDAATASAGADCKPESVADQTAALDTLFADVAMPAVTAPEAAAIAIAPALTLAAAPADGGGSDADALTMIAAAGQGATPNVAPKPAQALPQAQGDQHGDASTKGAAPADPQAPVPQIESGKDGQAHGGNDKAAGEFHRAAADLIAKLGGDAAAPSGGGDAAVVGAAKAGADAVQSASILTPANTIPATTATAIAPAQIQAQAVAVPLSGVAFEIAAQAHAGRHHFEIRLDPPELGRIDVKLDVDRDGNVSTRLVVDRSDTLDLLKRDASSLERALQQAGLKTSEHGLDFSLRQHAFAQDDPAAQNGARVIISDDDSAPLEALRQGYGRLLGLGGGLDIRV